MINQRHIHLQLGYKQQGFTILEFVVALGISVFLCIAVLFLYFTTSRLNHLAELNLKVQDDLRNSSLLISRDASQAGNFSCLTLGSFYQSDSQNTDNQFNREFHVFYQNPPSDPLAFDKPGQSANTANQNFGINVIPSNLLNVDNFQGEGNALIFYYGIGSSGLTKINYGNNGEKIESLSFTDGDDNQSLLSTAKQGGYLALASCHALNIFKINAKDALNFNSGDFGDVRISYEDETNKHNISEISLLRYMVRAYVVGTFNNQTGLYLIQLNENGTWGSPVLLSKYIQTMDTTFYYATSVDSNNNPLGCPSSTSDDYLDLGASSLNLDNLNQKFNNYQIIEKKNATFNSTTAPDNPKNQQGEDIANPLEEENRYLPPVAVEVELTIAYPNLGMPFGHGHNPATATSGESIHANLDTVANTSDQFTTGKYRLFSTIRGANQCANRNLLD